MRWRQLVIILAMMPVAGCRSSDGSWSFNPFSFLYVPDDNNTYLPHDHPDRFDTNMREYIDQGYGFRLNNKKKE